MTNSPNELEHIHRSLTEILLRRMPEPGDYPAVIDGLTTYRRDESLQLDNCIYCPLVTLLVQGFKSSLVGNQVLEYRSGQYMITGVDMPSVSHIREATPDSPFLSMTLFLDRTIIGQLILETPPNLITKNDERGMCVATADIDTLFAFHRLAELLDKPADLPVMGPMIVKELHYRLLTGPHGNRLRQLNTPGSPNSQIASAVTWLKTHFAEPLRIQDLAIKVNMSESTLYRQFKKLTTLSPLQYQKRMRLHEAQRLMVVEKLDANSTSLAVGYESPHQFNREYKRLFGQPPVRDVKWLR